jgi:hypothetical protein
MTAINLIGQPKYADLGRYSSYREYFQDCYEQNIRDVSRADSDGFRVREIDKEKLVDKQRREIYEIHKSRNIQIKKRDPIKLIERVMGVHTKGGRLIGYLEMKAENNTAHILNVYCHLEYLVYGIIKYLITQTIRLQWGEYTRIGWAPPESLYITQEHLLMNNHIN